MRIVSQRFHIHMPNNRLAAQSQRFNQRPWPVPAQSTADQENYLIFFVVFVVRNLWFIHRNLWGGAGSDTHWRQAA